jgi:hypothetical protein
MANVIDLTQKFTFGGPRSTAALIGICIHTTENPITSRAIDVAEWQARTQTGSYNELVDAKQNVVICNTDDWSVWATGNKGNDLLLHLSFVARASMTRAEWLAQMPMLETGADRAARWVKKYNFPIKKVAVSALPGFVGHVDTRAWGGTDHTDPGVNFPWDVFLQLVKDRVSGATQPPKEQNTMNKEQANQLSRNNHELTHKFQSRYVDADGNRSRFRDSAIGYALENDAKLTRLTDVILPRLESKLDTVIAHLDK